jgi:ribosomal protein L28
LTFVFAAGLGLAFANPDPEPSLKVLEGFKKEFPTAQQVTWTTMGDFEKATFLYSGRRVVAYFTKDGALEGSVRDMFYDQLPLAAMSAITKRFVDPDVLEVWEINNNEGTRYRLKLASKGRSIFLKVDGDGNISDVIKSHK